MLLNKMDNADVIPSLVRREFNRPESTLRGFKIRVMITEASTNAEMIAIHLLVRGEVKDGNSDEVSGDTGVVSLPVDAGGSLKNQQ